MVALVSSRTRILANASKLLNVRNQSTSTKSRDFRLAGRRRFYKHVGVMETFPPWNEIEIQNIGKHVDSPISAGVDGTQSASGVSTSKKDISHMKRLLRTKNSADGWYGVALDGRTVKTPLGRLLSLPSSELAAVIATEWDAQKTTLNPTQMPCMTLACTAIDQTTTDPEKIVSECLSYLNHDTASFHADPLEDRVLHRMQSKAWDGLHDFIETKFGAQPALALGAQDGLLLSRRGGLPHPSLLISNIKDYLSGLNAWQLTAVRSVITESKSCLVGLAFLEGFWNVEGAVAASRVEEEFQIENWGCVEGQHDYDRLNCKIQISSASLFIDAAS